MLRKLHATVLMVVLVAGIGISATAQQTRVTFIRVADVNTPIPEGTVTFAGHAGAFDFGPTVSNGKVVFAGLGSPNHRGIYSYLMGILEKVVDTNTLVPGRAMTFSTDFSGPSLDGDNIVFIGGFGSDAPAPFPHDSTAVFLYAEGELRVIADYNAPIPGAEDTFTGFFGASYQAGNTTFVGFGASGLRGTYLARPNGILDVVADSKTPIAIRHLSSGTVRMVMDISDRLAVSDDFAGQDVCCELPGGCIVSHNVSGVDDAQALVDTCLESGGTATVGNNLTCVNQKCARKDTLEIHSSGKISNDEMVFCAVDASGNKGIFHYTFGDSALVSIADLNTSMPEGQGTFSDFGVREGFDDGIVAFIGFGEDGQAGVYAYIDGELKVIASQNTPIPGGEGNFIAFSPFNGVAVSDGNIAFHGVGANEQGGIYLSTGDSLMVVLKHGDTLNGMTIKVIDRQIPDTPWWLVTPPLSMSNESFDDNQLVFLVELPDTTSAIYVATLEGISTSTEDPDFTSILSPFQLHQNYPNPFNPTTTIEYVLPRPAQVRLTIYDLLGREITTLVEEKQLAGKTFVVWDGRDGGGLPPIN